MEDGALCIRLLMFVTVLLSVHIQESYTQNEAVRISVNRLQSFEYESVSFHCEARDGPTQLKIIKNEKEFNVNCDNEKTSALTCTIRGAYKSDSGAYWCETRGGEKSNTVNITVTTGSVILESPALPVMEGNDVTLRCRNKEKSTDLRADFYKDGFRMGDSRAEEMKINKVSKSDEGFYTCSIAGVGASPESLLAVTEGNHLVHRRPPDVLTPLWIGVTILMVALVLLLRFLRKHRATLCFSSKTPTAASHSEENNQTVSADDLDTLTYAVVVTKQRKNKDTTDAADNVSLHLESNHSRKPQEEEDKDGPVYSTLNIRETSHVFYK